jgi:hypothetical protein
VDHTQPITGERQAEVGLGETLNAAAKRTLHGSSDLVAHVHGHHGALVEVYHEARGEGELVQDRPQARRRAHTRLKDDQGVVGVLQDRARGTVDQRVAEDVVLLDHPLQQITHQQVQVRREGITLAQPPLKLNPPPRDSIEQYGRQGGVEDDVHSVTLSIGETTGKKDLPQAPPVNGVKGLGEIQLQNNRRNFPLMAALHDLGSKDEILGDASATHETRLILINQGTNLQLKPRRESLADQFHRAVLQGDRPERQGSQNSTRLGQESDVGPVDAA